MKKTNLFLLTGVTLLMFSFGQVEAKSDLFAKGDKAVNLQVGFLSTWYMAGSYTNSMPQISISGDYGLRDDWGPGVFGVGAFIGYHTYKYNYGVFGGDYGWKYTQFHIAGRATYHYQFVNKLDTYAGAMLGLTFARSKEYGNWGGVNYTSDAGVSLLSTVFAGVRYYVTDKFSIMSELCIYDVALLNLGVSLKF
jgi:hypothetical protein